MNPQASTPPQTAHHNPAEPVSPTQEQAVKAAVQTEVSVQLLDGCTAVIRRAKGRALQNAMRIAQNDSEAGMIVAAHSTTIDGQPLNYEDFLDMDLADCYSIVGAYNALMGNSITPQA